LQEPYHPLSIPCPPLPNQLKGPSSYSLARPRCCRDSSGSRRQTQIISAKPRKKSDVLQTTTTRAPSIDDDHLLPARLYFYAFSSLLVVLLIPALWTRRRPLIPAGSAVPTQFTVLVLVLSLPLHGNLIAHPRQRHATSSTPFLLYNTH